MNISGSSPLWPLGVCGSQPEGSQSVRGAGKTGPDFDIKISGEFSSQIELGNKGEKQNIDFSLQ